MGLRVGGERVERAAELGDLRGDPGVRVAETLLEGGRRRPAEHLVDRRGGARGG